MKQMLFETDNNFQKIVDTLTINSGVDKEFNFIGCMELILKCERSVKKWNPFVDIPRDMKEYMHFNSLEILHLSDVVYLGSRNPALSNAYGEKICNFFWVQNNGFKGFFKGKGTTIVYPYIGENKDILKIVSAGSFKDEKTKTQKDKLTSTSTIAVSENQVEIADENVPEINIKGMDKILLSIYFIPDMMPLFRVYKIDDEKYEKIIGSIDKTPDTIFTQSPEPDKLFDSRSILYTSTATHTVTSTITEQPNNFSQENTYKSIYELSMGVEEYPDEGDFMD